VTTTLPISIDVDVPDLMKGVIAIRGLIRYDGDRVEIEYQTSSDSITYATAKTLGFDLAEIQRIEHRKGFFNHRLIFYGPSVSFFDGMPGADGERLTICIPRKHRLIANQLAWELQTTVEDRKLRGRKNLTS